MAQRVRLLRPADPNNRKGDWVAFYRHGTKKYGYFMIQEGGHPPKRQRKRKNACRLVSSMDIKVAKQKNLESWNRQTVGYAKAFPPVKIV